MPQSSTLSGVAPVSSLLVLAVYAAGAVLVVVAVGWWRRDIRWSEGLLYLALTTAFFGRPLLTGAIQVPADLAYESRPWSETLGVPVAVHNRRVEDTLLEQLPFHTLVRQRLLAGEVPLWSHELGTGQPLLGNAQSAPFAPLHLMALPLPPLRALPVSAAWAMLVHLLLTHALARALGAGRAGAVLAAVAVGLSTYAVVWAYDTLGMASAWVPGVLLGVVSLGAPGRDGGAGGGAGLPDGVRRLGEPGGHTGDGERDGGRSGRAVVGLVACSLGVATAGHPETLAHAGLAACGVALAMAVGMSASNRGRYVLRLAAAAVLAAALAAPVLLPFVQALPGSQRWDALGGGPDPFVPPPFEARYLLAVVDPFAFGGPFAATLRGPLDFVEMCSGYAGIVTLALAIGGALVCRGRILGIMLGGLGALLASLRVWPLFQVLSAAPFLAQATQARLRAFWVLAVALAAGLAIDGLAARARGRAWVVGTAVLGASVLLLAGAAPGAWERACWLLALAGLAAVAGAAAVPRWRSGLAVTAVGAVVVELFVLGAPYHPALAPRFDLTPPPALAYLIRRVAGVPGPCRVLAAGYDLAPNLAAVFGLWDPRGNDPMRPADSLRLLGERFEPDRDVGQNLRAAPGSFDAGFYDFLGVRFLLTRHGRLLPPPWRRVFAGTGGEVWENPGALPLFFMPRTVVRTADAEGAWDLSRGLVDFAQVGVEVGGGGAGPVRQAGEVRGIRPESNGFALHVFSGGGTVMSSVSYDPAWRGEVDGRPARVVEVDSGFLGIEVPAGAHRVELAYRPTGWPWGLAICGIGLMTASAAGGLSVVRARRHRRSKRRLRRQVPAVPTVAPARGASVRRFPGLARPPAAADS